MHTPIRGPSGWEYKLRIIHLQKIREQLTATPWDFIEVQDEQPRVVLWQTRYPDTEKVEVTNGNDGFRIEETCLGR